MSYWVILGCGYIGKRLAKALLADGEEVMACARNKSRLAELQALGADTYLFEASRRRAFHYAMGNARNPIVVYSLPPFPGLPGGELLSRAASESLATGSPRFVYLSSTSVYGEGRDGEVVDEDSPLSSSLDDRDARPYVSAEGAVEDARAKGLDAVILRLSPVYGPGRGVRVRMQEGTYKLLDDGEHVYSRIHVDDVVGIIRATVDRAPTNATYCLADDRPCPQREHAEWLARHLDTRMPPSVPSLAPGMPRRRIRNRAVSNARLKKELDYAFLYPTYREGEVAIDRELGVEVEERGPVPLVIHRGGDLENFAENTGFRRLSAAHHELAGGEELRVDGRGETMVYIITGAVEVDNSGDVQKLKAGDVLEVPATGAPLKNAGKKAAQILVVTA